MPQPDSNKPVPASAPTAGGEEIRAQSHGPVALTVALAPRGSNEDSTSAELPAGYPYRRRLQRIRNLQKTRSAMHGQSRQADWQISSCIVFNWDILSQCMGIAFK